MLNFPEQTLLSSTSGELLQSGSKAKPSLNVGLMNSYILWKETLVAFLNSETQQHFKLACIGTYMCKATDPVS